MRVTEETVRLAVVSRLGWIRKKKAALKQQVRESRRDMITGESHFVQGRRYRLNVIEQESPATVTIRNSKILEMRVRAGTDSLKRHEVLLSWYRKLLREQIPELLAKWEPIVGVEVSCHGSLENQPVRVGSKPAS